MTQENNVPEDLKGYSRITAPSQCAFYPKGIDSIYARPFDLIDISDLGTAKNSGDMPKFLKTVVATTNITPDLMTQDDFQALMYWHRLNSFPKKPMVLNYTCNNPKHNEIAEMEIVEGMSEETQDYITDAKNFLKGRKVVTQEDLKISAITLERFNILTAWLRSDRHTKEFVFMPATVSDMIEFTEITQLQLRNSKLNDLVVNDENYAAVVDEVLDATKDEIIVEVASMLSRTHGLSLSDRISFLKARILDARLKGESLFNTAFLDEIREYKELSYHGVSEEVQATCKFRGCEQAFSLTTEFDPFDFFPYL